MRGNRRAVAAVAFVLLLILIPIGAGPAMASGGSAPSPKRVTVLAKNQLQPQPIAVSGGYVYWYDYGSGQLNRVPESGGKVHQLAAADPSGGVYGLAVQGRYLYWEYFAANSTLWLLRTDILTGMTRTIYEASQYGPAAAPFAINLPYIYFVNHNKIYDAIDRIDTNGSGLAVLNGTSVPSPTDLVYSGDQGGRVYFIGLGGIVGWVPASGGDVTVLVQTQSNGDWTWDGVTDLIVEGSRLYWTLNGVSGATVGTVSTSGKGFKTLYSVSVFGPILGGLSYFDGRILFADNYDSAIYSVPDGGGKLRTVANYPVVNIEVSVGTVYIASGNTTVAKTAA